MSPSQAYRLERIERELNLSQGELLRMAREVAPRENPINCLADLTDAETEQLILMASTARELVLA